MNFEEKVREFLKQEIFNPKLQCNINMDEHRELTFNRLKIVLSSDLISVSEMLRDPEKYFILFNQLHLVDISLAVKFGVHIGLFGSAIYNLGTQKHHNYFFGMSSLDISGCFAMTEFGHGSNVFDLETIATFNPETKSFIIHTPSDNAQKYWIGNAAQHGNTAIVFAQLYCQNKNQGIHAFIVPLRKHGELCPGIIINDCGHKFGLNGVDNGRIWFDNVEIIYDNLLDKYGKINLETGEYQSTISDPRERFIVMLSSLVGGRIALVNGSIMIAKLGLTMAIKYALYRRQFKIDTEEIILLDYRLHQLRLIPSISQIFALEKASEYLIYQYDKMYRGNLTKKNIKKLHIESSALKVYATEQVSKILIECRRSCGGCGYISESRFGQLIQDIDIYSTFEGDNTILLQQVSQYLLSNIKNKLSNYKAYLYYLKYKIKKYSNDKGLSNQSILNALCYQEKVKTLQIANKCYQLSQKQDNKLELLNNIAPYILELAKLYSIKLVYKLCLTYSYDNLSKKMCNLYGLILLEQNFLFFLKNGYYNKSTHNLIKERIYQLCNEIRKLHIEKIIDYFNISENFYSPIFYNMENTKYYLQSKL